VTVVAECVGLDAGYGSVRVVRQLDLQLHEGSISALLGPNGAGKTTTLLTMSGMLPALGGAITILGEPTNARLPHRTARRGFAHVAEDRSLFTDLTVRDNLRLSARPGTVSVLDVLGYFPSLQTRYKTKAGSLSGGEQQMLAIARALVMNPKVLVIDEMSTGLAPVIVQELLQTITRVTQELRTAVLLVEQHVKLALEVATDVTVLSHGETVYRGDAAPLAADERLLERAYLSAGATASDVPRVSATPTSPILQERT
jgi:branched-chain amino acid transport system ATP-binding protein